VQGSETHSLVEALQEFSSTVIQTLETLNTQYGWSNFRHANMNLLLVLQRGVTAGEVAGMISGATSIGELC
jgi:hypothetical protein